MKTNLLLQLTPIICLLICPLMYALGSNRWALTFFIIGVLFYAVCFGSNKDNGVT